MLNPSLNLPALHQLVREPALPAAKATPSRIMELGLPVDRPPQIRMAVITTVSRRLKTNNFRLMTSKSIMSSWNFQQNYLVARASVAFGGFSQAACLAGCTVGPNYHRPTAPVPATWDVQEPWRESAPKDLIPKGEWWTVFHDGELSGLEKQAIDANQTIKISIARLEQARATAAAQISTLFTTRGLTPGTTTTTVERQGLSGNRPSSVFPVKGTVQQNTFSLPFVAGYEVDLFGRRWRSIESAEAAYQASAADLENVRLVVTAELAGDYFSLRALDSEIGILNRTGAAVQKGLGLVNSRHNGGGASGLDVAQEETLLHTTQTQATLLEQQRKQFEDAIAVLVGRAAPDFHVPIKELNAEPPPPLNAGLPSDLLERRAAAAGDER